MAITNGRLCPQLRARKRETGTGGLVGRTGSCSLFFVLCPSPPDPDVRHDLVQGSSGAGENGRAWLALAASRSFASSCLSQALLAPDWNLPRMRCYWHCSSLAVSWGITSISLSFVSYPPCDPGGRGQVRSHEQFASKVVRLSEVLPSSTWDRTVWMPILPWRREERREGGDGCFLKIPQPRKRRPRGGVMQQTG